MFGTHRLEPREAALLFENPDRARPARSDAAIAASGLRLDACIDLGTEWGEYLFETSGKPSRSLIHAWQLRPTNTAVGTGLFAASACLKIAAHRRPATGTRVMTHPLVILGTTST
jgi:hypothetical protein